MTSFDFKANINLGKSRMHTASFASHLIILTDICEVKVFTITFYLQLHYIVLLIV